MRGKKKAVLDGIAESFANLAVAATIFAALYAAAHFHSVSAVLCAMVIAAIVTVALLIVGIFVAGFIIAVREEFSSNDNTAEEGE